jgi:hypothetical protein
LEVVSIINQAIPPPNENGNSIQQFVNLNLYSADGIPYYYYYFGGSTPYEISKDYDNSTQLTLNATGGRQTLPGIQAVTYPTISGYKTIPGEFKYNPGRYVRIFNNNNRSNTALLFYVDGYSNWIDNNDKSSQNRTSQKSGNVLPLTKNVGYLFGLRTMTVNGKSTVCISRIIRSSDNIQIDNLVSEYQVFGTFSYLNNNRIFPMPYSRFSNILTFTINNNSDKDLTLSDKNIDPNPTESPDVKAFNMRLFQNLVYPNYNFSTLIYFTNTIFLQFGLRRIDLIDYNYKSKIKVQAYINSNDPTDIFKDYNSDLQTRYVLYKEILEYFNNNYISAYNIKYPFKKIKTMVPYNIGTSTAGWGSLMYL